MHPEVFPFALTKTTNNSVIPFLHNFLVGTQDNLGASTALNDFLHTWSLISDSCQYWSFSSICM